jgi:hypothetical protein
MLGAIGKSKSVFGNAAKRDAAALCNEFTNLYDIAETIVVVEDTGVDVIVILDDAQAEVVALCNIVVVIVVDDVVRVLVLMLLAVVDVD